MLYESDAITSVCKYLKKKNFRITQQLSETQRGDDITAIDSDGTKCFIEAKGETSSKEKSSRYRKPFSSSQVSVHIAKAFYRAVQMKEENSYACRVGIALPATDEHKKKVEKISNTLKQLSIEVFWVKSNKSVYMQGNWK